MSYKFSEPIVAVDCSNESCVTFNSSVVSSSPSLTHVEPPQVAVVVLIIGLYEMVVKWVWLKLWHYLP